MKYVLEFGNKGGFHRDNMIVPTCKLGAQLAADLVCMFENDGCAMTMQRWVMLPHQTRKTWENKTHFVALSKLDGKDRGAASPGLWRKGGEPFMGGNVITS